MPPSRVGPHSQLSFGSRWPCGERTSAICLTICPRARHVHERRQARLAPSPRSRRATRRCATSSTSRARDEIIGYNLKLPRRGRRGRCRAGVSQSGSIFAKAATVLYSPGIYCIPREYTVFPARGACCERSCQELPCRRAPCPPDCATTPVFPTRDVPCQPWCQLS